MSTNNFIKSALRNAKRGKHGIRVGAVIVSGGRTLSGACNRRRYSQRLPNRVHEERLCAEQAAILKLLKKKRWGGLYGSTLYVARITIKGDVTMAKPCLACETLSRTVGIRKIFYTDYDSQIKEMRL